MKLIGELKEKVEAAESREEARRAIEDAGIELTDDELDGIAGGLRHDLFADRHDGPTGGKSEQMPTVHSLTEDRHRRKSARPRPEFTAAPAGSILSRDIFWNRR